MSGDKAVRGAVYVEFLAVSVPLIVLFFSLAQMSLFLSAGILVNFAALKAARSSMVVLGDNHEDATYKTNCGDAGGDNGLYCVGNGDAGVAAYEDADRKSRYETIRTAARAPLVPVSPGIKKTFGSLMTPFRSMSLESALGQVGKVDVVTMLTDLDWTSRAVGLGFLNTKGEYVSKVKPGDNARVRVVLLLPCFVPIGRDLACHRFNDLPKDHRELIQVNGNAGQITNLLGWRFVTLVGEAPIPRWDR
ncbi:MAG: pilus assembly protein [Deltaproteobacteria bacterium]|nr:pilus assembly protein [Deltaproteobacteria bacterium]